MNHVIKNRIRQQVLVTTKQGVAFEGVLWDSDRDALILRQTVHVEAGERSNTSVDGELLVKWDNVAFVQIV